MLGLLTGSVLAATAGVAPAATSRPHSPTAGASRSGTHSGARAASRLGHPEQDVAGAGIKQAEGTAGAGRGAGPANRAGAAGTLPGMDVSSHQGAVDFGAAAAGGGTFVYAKATEGTDYSNPYFDDQFSGAGDAGMYRGAYHFALPDQSSGAYQAEYFLDNGGDPTGYNGALPPAVDIEYNPYGDACYGMSPGDMVRWLHDFTATVENRTRLAPVIYTSTKWWAQCTANDRSFGATDPLWVPHYGSSVGALPAGWNYQTFWQFADHGPFPGDQDEFNGSHSRLGRMAQG